MNSYGHSRFASELNKLLGETSLSPEDVIVELSRRSFPMPLHTFSYWLQGYFLPRSESAFQLVGVLERIFGVSDNRLADALLEDLSSGNSFVPGESVQSAIIGDAPRRLEGTRFSTTADSTSDWEANLIQKVVRDEVRLSADLEYARYKVTILADLRAAAFSTRSRILEAVDSSKAAVVRTRSTPLRLMDPDRTVSSTPTPAGRLSPVNAAVSRAEAPSATTPSMGTRSPGWMTRML